MNLAALLKEKRDLIAQGWSDELLGTYPQETVKFFKNVKDTFRNPVGQTITSELTNLTDLLIADSPPSEYAESLDAIIRIRAVQDFSPSQSVGFVFALKQVVRDVLKAELQDSVVAGELRQFEVRIDHLALQAFDNYMDCREQIFRLRTSEIKRQTHEIAEQRGATVVLESDLTREKNNDKK